MSTASNPTMLGKCPEIFLIGLSHQPLRNPDVNQMLKKPMMKPTLSYKMTRPIKALQESI